jgi:phage terminase large subunit-like protein
MSALVLVFAGKHGEFDIVPFCWLPGETLQEARDRDRMPYLLWARQGHLLTFPGRTTHPKAIASKITYAIKAFAYDRWRIEDLTRELDAIGCNVPLTPFGQGFKDLSPAVDALERLVEEGKLRHGKHPVMSMAATNTKVEIDSAGNRKLSKKEAPAGSIRSLLCAWRLVLPSVRRRRSMSWQ